MSNNNVSNLHVLLYDVKEGASPIVREIAEKINRTVSSRNINKINDLILNLTVAKEVMSDKEVCRKVFYEAMHRIPKVGETEEIANRIDLFLKEVVTFRDKLQQV